MKPASTPLRSVYARLICAGLLLLLASVRVQAEDAELELRVKAACLYNFTKFVQWPDSKFNNADAPIVIGIIGDDPFGAVLDETVKGRKAQERRVVVKRYRRAEDAKEAHILYISRSEAERQAGIVNAVKRSGVLIVGETATIIQDGGAIRFVIRNDKLSFDIDIDCLKGTGISISAHLLRLANIVRSEEK